MHPLLAEKLERVRLLFESGPLDDPWDLYDLSFYMASKARREIDAKDFSAQLDPRIVALAPDQKERLDLISAFLEFLKTPEINPEIVAIFAALANAREQISLIPMADFVLTHWQTLSDEKKTQLLYSLSDLARSLPPDFMPLDRRNTIARRIEESQIDQSIELPIELKNLRRSTSPV